MHELQTKDGESVELKQLILAETYFAASTDNYRFLNQFLFEKPARNFAPVGWKQFPFHIHYGDNDPSKMLPPIVGAAMLVKPNHHRAGFHALTVYWFQWNYFDDTMGALIAATSQVDWAAMSEFQRFD